MMSRLDAFLEESREAVPSLSPLPNRLVEVAVIVGVDENSGLNVVKDEDQSDYDPSEKSLSETVFEPKLIGAVSSQHALFPFRLPPRDKDYPPHARQLKRAGSVGSRESAFGFRPRVLESPLQQSFDDARTTSDNQTHKPGFHSTHHAQRRLSRKMSLASLHYSARDSHASLLQTVPHLPVPYDVLQNLTGLCYPENISALNTGSTTSAHYLVLTDVEGNRSYATCLRFYKRYVMSRMVSGDRWDYHTCNDAGEVELEPGQFLKYLPQSIVFISKYPFFTTLKDCLSKLVKEILEYPLDWRMALKKYTLQLTMTPVPPPGTAVLKFPLQGAMFTLHPAINTENSIIDIPLRVVFEHLETENVLKLIACLLTQQKIVFLCSSYSLLTVVMQSFLLLLEPFQWNSPYVPVLSRSMLELLEAPGALLMGCHSECLIQVSQVEGLVLVNIDTGEVRLPESSHEVPSLPCEPAFTFKAAMRKVLLVHDPQELEWSTPFSYEDMATQRWQHQSRVNQMILDASAELLVTLFRDVLSHIKVEHRFFNRDQFMETLPDVYRDFYQEVLHTQMFNTFLGDRFAQRKDRWSLLEKQTRMVQDTEESALPRARMRRSRSAGITSWDFVRNATKRTKSDCSERGGPRIMVRKRGSSLTTAPSLQGGRLSNPLPQPLPPNSDQVILLPMYNYESHRIYYSKSIEMLSIKSKDSSDIALRAACTYVAGMLKVANNQPTEAIKDFQSLSAQNSSIFPTQVFNDVLSSLPDSSRPELPFMPLYNGVGMPIVDEMNNGLDTGPILMNLDKLPNADIDKDQFIDLVQILEIAVDLDTIKRLFEALTLGDDSVVDPETFKLFYEAWKEVEMECVGFNLPGLNLEANECFIKVSTITRTSLGTGRLALTQKRLFVLNEGSRKVTEVIKLRDIQCIERTQQRSSFFSQVPALKVTSRNTTKPVFIASVKSGCDAWLTLVREMWYGKLMAEELRDAGLIQQAAQNVLLIDAVIRSGEEELCCYHEDVNKAVSYLAYFTSCWADGKGILAAETKDVLQHCVDPNIRELERKAVETLLYTPGRRSAMDEDEGPKLWCGMGNGKVKVFDGSTWLLETTQIQAKDRVVCLISVNGNQIWAGSLDQTVYVIDATLKTCNQCLQDHQAMVVDLVYAKDLKRVFSAGIDGQIIGWDVKSLQKVQEFNVPSVKALRCIHFDKLRFWCCSRDNITMTDLDGNVLRKTELVIDGEHRMLDCMLLTPHGKVWAGCRTRGTIGVWEADSLESLGHIELNCRGVGCMVRVQDKIWVGTKDGIIFIVNMITREVQKQLKAHSDVIRSMCTAQTRYVMSGSGSQDGKIAIWRTSAA